ncbi:hypothetical protein L2E82_32247 [Cichorium intybus]|uniref:Uncharacterized protein n=1 Tax=Cichorium intybus TaxID=13427 RepID=A0ACB9BHI4_CICIN|nr:hypothetical protein L2E82_32247 [Cichorium intybus]
MPASALDHLATLPIFYPMLFRIENIATGIHSHCGVLEFTADEGNLPKGSYIKIQPHATKFTTLSDHKSLLEKTFRDFSCLTVGDTIVVDHEEEKYSIDIVETKPSLAAVSLFETDCEVDFATPLDYKEPEKKPTTGRQLVGKRALRDDDLKSKESTTNIDKHDKKPGTMFKPFMGGGEASRWAIIGDEGGQKEEDQLNVEVTVKEKDEGFKAFTGKSFRLG